MASPPSSTQISGGRSHFKPTVTLYDWWLIKSEEKDQETRLAVAGVSSRLEIPRRVFNSAPITKSHDVFTLETTDGVCVILGGLINKQQTVANGFSEEIAKRFQLGFYPGWEKGVAEFLGGDSNTAGVSVRISDSGSQGEGKNNCSPTSGHSSQEETQTPYGRIGSIYFQWFGRSKSQESNQKNPMSACSMKQKSTKLPPSSDAFESVGGVPSSAAVKSGGQMNKVERCPRNSARRVSRLLSEFMSKWTNQQIGNGLNKTTDSVLTVSKTVKHSLQNDKREVGAKGAKKFSPTSMHHSLEEGSPEQVSCKDMRDAEFLKLLSSKISLDNHAVEEETYKEDFRPIGLQSVGTSEVLEESEKTSVSTIKHSSAHCSHSTDAGAVASGVTIPFAGEIDVSMIHLRNSGGRVFGDSSIITRTKGKMGEIVWNGLNSGQNTVDSVPAVETVSNTSQNVDCEGGGRHKFESFLSCCERALGVINIPTFMHFSHETPNEKVQCEDRLDHADVEVPNQISTNLSSESTIDDKKVDDLMKHAAEMELDVGNAGLSEFNSVEGPQTREVIEKNTESEPVSEALEIQDRAVDANAQSGGKMDISDLSPSKFAGRVSQLFSGILRRKGKKQAVGNGLNSETNTINSVPAVSGIVSNPLENDNCETVGNGMPHPSDSERQEPVDVNVVRKLDFDFVEGDMQQTFNTKEGQDFGNVTTEVGEEESGANEENKFRKRNMRKVTIDTQEIHFSPETEANIQEKVGLNQKKHMTPTFEDKKKKDGTPVVNKKSKVSLSTLQVTKKTRLTPSTLEVKSNKELSFSTPKVNTKKRKVSPSLEGSKKRTPTPLTLKVNSIKKVSHSTPKINTKKRKASSSMSEVSKKNKLSPLTLAVYNSKEASFSTPKVNMKIISPESLSAGRSRSGRLLLPPLEFWRNQTAIYDKDHGVIGIEEELPTVTPSRGSTSEPPKRKANRG
ncbi:uncharacterized protein LOC126797965 isoform X2 [Argentina anserina]|uniref:uncharacterized protein LOC126797965 isoform X2 n=1 Tax=Argentina anserina TaxID=57926 RepID=UPI00217625FF|nr:uncharacterized protein LOC126797965 isoform X2 [Potentilla anserina]